LKAYPEPCSITIAEALDCIASRSYVLPAIQREFVWNEGQVCALFDSLMQGYSFGEFLFWLIQPSKSGDIDSKQQSLARRLLDQLHRRVHQDRAISYYPESS